MGPRGSRPLENYKWLYVYLGILVRTPHEKQLDPRGPNASGGRSLRPNTLITCTCTNKPPPPTPILPECAGPAHIINTLDYTKNNI